MHTTQLTSVTCQYPALLNRCQRPGKNTSCIKKNCQKNSKEKKKQTTAWTQKSNGWPETVHKLSKAEFILFATLTRRRWKGYAWTPGWWGLGVVCSQIKGNVPQLKDFQTTKVQPRNSLTENRQEIKELRYFRRLRGSIGTLYICWRIDWLFNLYLTLRKSSTWKPPETHTYLRYLRSFHLKGRLI